MRIAIVGSGIAGNVAAQKLRDDFDITVYEAADYVGGHTNTVDVEEGDRTVAVDTGLSFSMTVPIRISSSCLMKSARRRYRAA